jgi:protein TonB
MLHSLLALSLAAAAPNANQPAPADTSRTVAARPAPADSVYAHPEVAPQFVGGNAALTAFMRKTMHYPDAALRRNVHGQVVVSFVLSEKGQVIDAHVLRGPGFGLDQEALRVVWLMPRWTPGQVNGQPVRVACTIPIGFNN